MTRTLAAAMGLTAVLMGGASSQTWAADTARVARTDIPLVVQSIAPGYMGKYAELYVREVKLASSTGASKGVVLFVHGAGSPAEVAFDTPYKDYSWMAYLARAGFDVYSMDLEGYGLSSRPPAMEQPCNLGPDAQKQLIPRTLKAACASPSTQPITTMSSDWNDIGAVVNFLLSRNKVQTLALVGWSQGGPRTAGYAAKHPEQISRLVVLAPAYRADMDAGPPAVLPAVEHPLTFQSQADFKANWDGQAPCAGQYEPAAAGAVWSEMAKSDPAGAKWGPGGRRAPSVPSWGFNKEVVAKMTTPFLMVTGENDKQIAPALVHQLYDDLGSPQKVIIDLACSSHNAMWEKNHLMLFQASADWLSTGKVDGMDSGIIKKGY